MQPALFYFVFNVKLKQTQQGALTPGEVGLQRRGDANIFFFFCQASLIRSQGECDERYTL